MKKFFILFIAVFALCSFTSCNYQSNNQPNDNADSISVVSSLEYDYYQNWFTNFEKENPNWIESKNGMKLLKQSFDNKITSDNKFAHSLISNSLRYIYSEHRPNILTSESITKATIKSKNLVGELKAFLMAIDVELNEPMYNGQKNITLYYEIINFIPSTVEDHEIPYCENINTYIKNKSIYFNDRQCSDKIIGSYYIGISDNK